MTKKFKFFLGAIALAFVVSATAGAQTYTFSGTLKAGSRGASVWNLQKFLNMCPGTQVAVVGAGSPGMETQTFGPATKAAVVKFQVMHGLGADGIFGPMSAAKAMSLQASGNPCGTVVVNPNLPAGCSSSAGYSTVTGQPCSGGANLPAGCSSTVGYSPTTGVKCDSSGSPSNNGSLSGTVGTISYSLTSGYSNEEVGEDENDVKVAGLELDLDDSDSDVQVTAVKINFDVGTAGSDFEDYADEVSVWLGNTKVASLDGDEFNDDNDFEKTVSLSNAIVRMGDVEDLYVAVSGVSNLDSGDVGDTWTVDFTLVRFVDAQGATTSEDPTESAVTFSFESFATASDVELVVSEGDDDINDARVINVDATDDTDGIEILSFNLEAEGDSDIVIDSLPVTVTTVETTGNDPDDLISTYYLFAGNEEIGSETNPSTDTTDDSTSVIVFDDLDYTLEAGDEVEFTVKVDVYSLADALDAGDTIQATFGETQTDLATFDAEDESGEALADADKTGTVTGGTHEVRDIGITVDLVSTSATVNAGDPSAAAPVSDSGLFTITFDVEAFDGDVYIDHTAPDASGGATESDLAITGTGTAIATITSSTGAEDGTEGFLVEEGTTERFTITTNVLATASGFFAVELDSLLYALTDVDGDVVYTFNLADFKTSQVYLNDY